MRGGMHTPRPNRKSMYQMVLVFSLTTLFCLPGCQSSPDLYQKYLEARIEIAQVNIANANTAIDSSGDNNPYRLKAVTWHEEDRTWSISEVPGKFRRLYAPMHPMADANGYVRYPNVDVNLERLNFLAAQEDLLAYQDD